MPRGNRNYYDPILQTPGQVEGAADLSRIELFPVGQESTSRLPEQIGKWMARRIDSEGRVVEESPGDFDHDRALAQAEHLWPGLTVYELNAEIEDSTWEGTGPSPRLWQNAPLGQNGPNMPGMNASAQVFLPPAGQMLPINPPLEVPDNPPSSVHAFEIAEPGVYVRLNDILMLLEGYAAQFDQENNPSAALGLREAAQALREPF